MSFSDVLQLAKIGKTDIAAILLKEEFGKLQSPEQRYEMTGLLSLGETSSDPANAIRALPEYEKAREYYTLCGDEEKVELCSSVISQLNKCFVAS